jgi:cytidylate kinase
MRRFSFKKIITGLLIIAVFSSTSAVTFLAAPKKAEAFLGIGDISFDPSNFAENVVNVANTTGTLMKTYSLELKAFVLDTLATTLAKQLIRSLTASVVNWINNGFQGSPSFLTNPGSFFLDVADQVTGAFIAGAGGPLSQLCTNFSIDIRLQLSFKYHSPQTKYACTLSTLIKNAKNASVTVNGSSVAGFVNGDFRQGGLPAFVSLTTDNRNNPYGAYLEADSELGIRVNNLQKQQQSELGAGKGFFSWRDPSCVKAAREEQRIVKNATDHPDSEYATQDYDSAVDASGGDLALYGPSTEQDCPIKTPGSVIVSSLEENINGPLHELQLVDSINQIVNALAAQLVNSVLKGGLSSISGTGPSDSTSYIYQMQAEANAAPAITFTKDSLIHDVDNYLSSTQEYKNNEDQAVVIIQGALSRYESAKQCWTGKLTTDLTLNATIQSKIDEIDSIENSQLNPLLTQAENRAALASQRFNTLYTIKTQATSASTAEQLNVPSQSYSQLLQSQNLTTPKDISDSKQHVEDATSTTDPMRSDAAAKLQQCESYTAGYSSTSGIR